MYWLTGIVGLFMIIAPYAFNYSDNPVALWTSIIAGLIVLVMSIWEGMEKRQENWEYWVVGIVGIFAIVAPFILGFGTIASAMWTTVILGAVVAILAVSKLWMRGNTESTKTSMS